jgi:hypothetical protein
MGRGAISREALFQPTLIDNLQILDTWEHLNGNVVEYTYVIEETVPGHRQLAT